MGRFPFVLSFYIFFKVFFKKYLCIYWLRWLSVAVHRLSLGLESGGYSPVVLCRLLIVAASLVWSTGSRREDSVVCHTALVALQLVGSSRTRDQISVPCIGRWILNNWTTREGPDQLNLTEVTLCDF